MILTLCYTLSYMSVKISRYRKCEKRKIFICYATLFLEQQLPLSQLKALRTSSFLYIKNAKMRNDKIMISVKSLRNP